MVAPAAKLTGLTGAEKSTPAPAGRPGLGLHLHGDAARHSPSALQGDGGVAGVLAHRVGGGRKLDRPREVVVDDRGLTLAVVDW